MSFGLVGWVNGVDWLIELVGLRVGRLEGWFEGWLIILGGYYQV
jgi:hypothetical protein